MYAAEDKTQQLDIHHDDDFIGLAVFEWASMTILVHKSEGLGEM
jgi:hypothetical protein